MNHSQRSQHRHSHGIRSVLFSYCGALLTVLVASSILLVGCGVRSQSATALPPRATTPTPAATLTPPAFSPFHEWRAAYIDSDEQLHAVTLDGTNDGAGPYLSPIQEGSVWTSAGFSPDGHYLAFQVPNLTILDATRRNARTPLEPTLLAYAMAWSPQGDTLAVYTGPEASSYTLVNAATGQTRHVPGISTDLETPGSVAELIGWIDATHLAVTLVPGGPYATPYDPLVGRLPFTTTLASLNITTGAVRRIVTITFSSPPPRGSRFLISPDGTRALFYTWQSQTQLVDVIDIATGQVTPLPTIAAQIAKSSLWMAAFAWRPGSDTIAASLPLQYPSPMQAVLLDIRGDTVTHLNLIDNQFVEGWTPDGKTLIVSSDWGRSASTLMSPHTISALTFDPNGQTSLVVLTHDACLAPFVGFVRTA